MWVIFESFYNDSYDVGYYKPNGHFAKIVSFASLEEAMRMCSYLNGGGA